jgi:MFS family permease
MGFGIGAYAYVNTIFWLVFFSLVWSIGFHGWAPLQGTMALAFSEENKKGKRLGQLRSITGLAYLSGLVFAFSVAIIDFKGVYLTGGFVIALGGLVMLFATRETSVKRERKFLLRKEYSIYYILNFLLGCRKQIFVVFAVFTLVKVYGITVKTIITLMVINQIATIFTGQLIGTFVDKYGERRMLAISYIGLTFVFLGYATIHNPYILFVCYFMDNLLNFGAIALTTYINKIAPSEDIRPTLSMGVTMNHIAAVLTPLVGGILWKIFSYEIIFFIGASISLISLLVSFKIKAVEGLGKKGTKK